MIKKVLTVLLVTLILLPFGVGNAFAVENVNKTVDKVEYQQMMKQVKSKIEQGKEDEIGNIPEVTEFKEKYTKEEINDFVVTTEAFKNAFDLENASNELDSEDLEVGKNEEKIVEYEDGSFVVVNDTTVEEPGIMALASASRTGTAGKNYKTDYKQKWYGFYLAAEAHLITRYTLHKTKIDIYDTDTAGTRAIIPTTVDSISSSIVIDNKKSVQSKMNFRKTNGVVIGGFPIGSSRMHTLRTTISISSVSGSTIKFKTKSVSE